MSPFISCEHATFYVPREYRKWFAAEPSILRTHEGVDRGARKIARALGHALQTPLWMGSVSRLLVDLNRSIDNPQIFSRFVSSDAAIPQHLLACFYYPYRDAVGEWVRSQIATGLVVHFGIHSFTPDFPGSERNFDLGLLYDPANSLEIALAHEMGNCIETQGHFSLRHNQPYLGTDDGLTTALRRRFAGSYAGIEIEVNQALVDDKDRMQFLVQQLRQAIEQATLQIKV